MSRVLALDAKVAVRRGHDHYWRVILELDGSGGPWTIRDIHDRSDGDRASVRDFVRRLVAGGYAGIAEERPAQGGVAAWTAYRLLKTSREAPRLTRCGRELPEPLQETLWRTMKLLKTFTSAQLASAADGPARTADRVAADSYCRRLAAAGVLRVTAPGDRGRGKQTYRLMMGSLGPLAPKILRTHHVYDPNAQQILGVAEAREPSS